MKKIIFNDSSEQEIQVSLSGGGDIRIYTNSNDSPIKCITLNENQANILISAISDLMEDSSND